MTTTDQSPEAALQEALNAYRSQAMQYLESVPLRAEDIAHVAAELARSPELSKALAKLQQEHAQNWIDVLNGVDVSGVTDTNDKRFRSAEWHDIPWFSTLRKLYALDCRYLSRFAELLDPKTPGAGRIAFLCKQVADALAPSNNPLTNPQALTKAYESGGQSFLSGAKMFAEDMGRRRVSMSDSAAFEIGRNIAATPGAVVFENELIQLIQYQATRARVCSTPLLIIPPFINKFYILDLQESNSFVRYCVDEGMTTFIISWRDIPESLGALTWDDYIEKGVFQAIEVVHQIAGGKAINTLGFCVGGTLLATALAVYAARQESKVASLTLLASMLDFSDTGEINVYVDEHYVDQVEREVGGGGVVRGSRLSAAFASLRANDLVWHFVVNNYLLGNEPPAFDLLYWNSDASNLPGPLYAYYLRNMYLEDRLKHPGMLSMCGLPIDLGAIDVPAMIVAAREDHIVPWKTAYRSAMLLGAEVTFVLGASGHVAGIVNPPSGKRRKYWMTRDVLGLPVDVNEWQAAAKELDGSWWPEWIKWLRLQGGERVPARKKLGNREYAPIEAAPGRFVREHQEPD